MFFVETHTHLDLIKKNGNIENAIATIGSDSVPSFDEIKQIRKIFLEPEVEKNYSISWTSVDKKAVIEILCNKHQFKKDRVEPILEKYSNVGSMMKQKTLF